MRPVHSVPTAASEETALASQPPRWQNGAVRRSGIQLVCFAALVLVAIFYFGYHAVQGNHGLLKLMELRAETIELETQASEVAAEKVALEMKVNNLRKDNLDLDLLDERARAVLGFQEQDEIVIFLDDEE